MGTLVTAPLASTTAQASTSLPAPPITKTGALHLKTQNPLQRAPGFSIGLETLDRELFDLQAVLPALKILPVKKARIQSGWFRCEPVAGTYHFAWLDDCVNKLLALGIEPWISVGYGNKAYMPDVDVYGAVGWVPYYSGTAMKAWLKYVAKLAARYQGKVTYFEIWNEPWEKGMWVNDTPNPYDYAAFAIPTMKAMRAANPGTKFVTGSVTLSDTALNFARNFLDAGVASHADVLCFHQYARIPDDYYVSKVAKFREMLTKYSRHITLWQGEGGAPSVKGTDGVLFNYDWDTRLQAKWIMRKLVAETYIDLELTSYFHLIDLAARNDSGKIVGSVNYKGLLNLDATPKLAFTVFRYMLNLLNGKVPLAAGKGNLIFTSSDNVVFYNFAASKTSTTTNLIAFWNKGDYTPSGTVLNNVVLTMTTGSLAMLSDYVLFNPITLSVYKIKATSKKIVMPLKDYPLFIVKLTTLQAFGTVV